MHWFRLTTLLITDEQNPIIIPTISKICIDIKCKYDVSAEKIDIHCLVRKKRLIKCYSLDIHNQHTFLKDSVVEHMDILLQYQIMKYNVFELESPTSPNWTVRPPFLEPKRNNCSHFNLGTSSITNLTKNSNRSYYQHNFSLFSLTTSIADHNYHGSETKKSIVSSSFKSRLYSSSPIRSTRRVQVLIFWPLRRCRIQTFEPFSLHSLHEDTSYLPVRSNKINSHLRQQNPTGWEVPYRTLNWIR